MTTFMILMMTNINPMPPGVAGGMCVHVMPTESLVYLLSLQVDGSTSTKSIMNQLLTLLPTTPVYLFP